MKQINHRTFLAYSAAAIGAAVGLGSCSNNKACYQGAKAAIKDRSNIMKAGFARVKITPPVGTRMTGFDGRDRKHGSGGVHEDVYARALYLV